MNLGYIYNYKDYEELIKSNFSDNTLLHENDIPLDKKNYYVGLGLNLEKNDNNEYYFRTDLNKLPYNKVQELKYARHIQDLGLLQAINNRYIPIVDNNDNILFTKEDFDNIRKNMAGLSIYGAEEYEFSTNLDLPGLNEIISKNKSELEYISSVDNSIINVSENAIEEKLGLSKESEDKKSNYRLINTGSTGRRTNVAGDMDFDYAVIMDLGEFKRTFTSKMFVNVERFKKLLESKFVIEGGYVDKVSSARLRLKNIPVEFSVGNEEKKEMFDIDFSFFSNSQDYFSTVDSLVQRLDKMKSISEEKYEKVLGNIIYAKTVLKLNNAYKPSRSDKNQGGLGGVGVENWIIQHGGSFIDAATSFISVAQKYIEKYNVDLTSDTFDNNDINSPAYKAFIDFQKEYTVFDFGKSIEAVSKGNFPYDNFVMRNMRTNGFINMYKCLVNQLELLKNNNYVNDSKKTI